MKIEILIFQSRWKFIAFSIFLYNPRSHVMIDREQIHRQLLDADLNRIADDILGFLRPCLCLRTTPSNDSTIPIGCSKFGGAPDVPKDFSWPEWEEQPLAFLGQINLSTISENPIASSLPSNGLLSFFYDYEQTTWGFDPEDKGSWQVYHFPNDSLTRYISNFKSRIRQLYIL